MKKAAHVIHLIILWINKDWEIVKIKKIVDQIKNKYTKLVDCAEFPTNKLYNTMQEIKNLDRQGENENFNRLSFTQLNHNQYVIHLGHSSNHVLKKLYNVANVGELYKLVSNLSKYEKIQLITYINCQLKKTKDELTKIRNSNTILKLTKLHTLQERVCKLLNNEIIPEEDFSPKEFPFSSTLNIEMRDVKNFMIGHGVYKNVTHSY
jgi:hypothetical protein